MLDLTTLFVTFILLDMGKDNQFYCIAYYQTIKWVYTNKVDTKMKGRTPISNYKKYDEDLKKLGQSLSWWENSI